MKNKITDKKNLIEIKRRVEKEIIDSHAFAKESNYPKKNEIGKYVFKEKKSKNLLTVKIASKEVLIKSSRLDVEKTGVIANESHAFVMNKQYQISKDKNVINKKKTSI